MLKKLSRSKWVFPTPLPPSRLCLILQLIPIPVNWAAIPDTAHGQEWRCFQEGKKKKDAVQMQLQYLTGFPIFLSVYIKFIEMCVHKNCNIRSAVIQSLKGDLRTSAAPTTVCRRSSNVPGIHRTLCTYLLMDALAINRRVQIAVVLEIRCSYK